MTTQELMMSRRDNIMDVVNRRPAKWVPLISINNWGAFAYAGKSYWELENDFEALPREYSKIYADMPADASTGDAPSFNGRAYEIMNKMTQYLVTEDGFNIQHLQDSKMLGDEYARAIADPHKYIREVIIPRKFPFLFEMDPKDAAKKLIAMTDAVDYARVSGPCSKIKGYVEEHYGVYHFIEKGSYASITTPGDYLMDRFRGFKGTLVDLRRHYEEMKTLCDVLWEQNFANHFENAKLTPDKFPQYNAHIPTFLNTKQYADLCYKYYKQQIENITAAGSHTFLLAEGTWKHLFDFFKDLPKNSVLFNVENDDVIESKKDLGDYQIILGGSKMCDLRLATEQECIEKAKAVVDACAPGGAFMFSTDKSWSCGGDLNANLVAVYNFVHEYAKY